MLRASACCSRALNFWSRSPLAASLAGWLLSWFAASACQFYSRRTRERRNSHDGSTDFCALSSWCLDSWHHPDLELSGAVHSASHPQVCVHLGTSYFSRKDFSSRWRLWKLGGWQTIRDPCRDRSVKRYSSCSFVFLILEGSCLRTTSFHQLSHRMSAPSLCCSLLLYY